MAMNTSCALRFSFEKCKKEKEQRSVAEIRLVVIGTPWSLVIDTANYDISRLSKCPIRQRPSNTAYRMPRQTKENVAYVSDAIGMQF